MQKLRFVAKNLLMGTLILVLVLNLFLILGQSFSRGKLQKLFGLAQVVVISGSMQPAIKVGDMIIIRQASKYVVGDVVTYRSGASLVTHRLIALEGSKLITQGDANNTPDEPIALEQVEGKVVLRLPLLGRLSLLLKTPTGLALLALAGVGLILASVFSDIKKDRAQLAAGESQ